MKEIKYRGKEINSNQWVYGDLLHITNGVAIFRNAQNIPETGESEGMPIKIVRGEISMVMPDTIGVYLPAIKAYEGDLLTVPSMAHLLEVFIDDYGIRLKDVSNGLVYGAYLFHHQRDEFVIVGNKYDNPLLGR